MIRVMKNIDLAQCGMIYAKAFPMEHWGIDWTAENATEYLRDFFEQKRFVGYVYEENDEVLGCIFALCKISGSKEEIYIQTRCDHRRNLYHVSAHGHGRAVCEALLADAGLSGRCQGRPSGERHDRLLLPIYRRSEGRGVCFL